MEDYKTTTKRAYDLYAHEFDRKFGEHFRDQVVERADAFLSELEGRRVLDIGCGPGNHAEYFRGRGYEVVCGDISEAMVGVCRAKGLNARVMDVENLPADETFDGVWAYAVLLHLKKDRILPTVKTLASALAPRGVLGVAVKEGTGEGFETHHRYPDTERWFSYVTDDEMRGILDAAGLEVVSFEANDVKGKYVFLHYICRKNRTP